jgi:hypothetical protein
LLGTLALAAALSTCLPSALPASAAEKPLPAEKNPPGDIPDNQVFIAYKSPLGFTLQVPEGWARTDRTNGVRFADKYDVIDAVVASASTAPTAASVRSRDAADLSANGRAVKIGSIEDIKLKGGTAVRVTYTSNSDPNPVTSKQIRLEHERFIFFKSGKVAAIDFAAPQGADNADQWQLMSNSFRWN